MFLVGSGGGGERNRQTENSKAQKTSTPSLSLAFLDWLRAPHLPVLFPVLPLVLPLARPIATRSRGRSAKRASAAPSAGAYLGEPSLPPSSSVSGSVSVSLSSVEFFTLAFFPTFGGGGGVGSSGASTSNSSLTSDDELDVPFAPAREEAGAVSPAGTPSSSELSSGSVDEGEGLCAAAAPEAAAEALPLSASGSGLGVSERSSLFDAETCAWATRLASRIAKSRTQRSSAVVFRPEWRGRERRGRRWRRWRRSKKVVGQTKERFISFFLFDINLNRFPSRFLVPVLFHLIPSTSATIILDRYPIPRKGLKKAPPRGAELRVGGKKWMPLPHLDLASSPPSFVSTPNTQALSALGGGTSCSIALED